jgi:hypothetical protein
VSLARAERRAHRVGKATCLSEHAADTRIPSWKRAGMSLAAAGVER